MATTHAALKDATLHEVDARDGKPSATDLARYREDGVIVMRHVFAPGACRGIVGDLERRTALLERHHGLARNSAEQDGIEAIGRRIAALDASHPGAQSILYDAMSKAPSMHAMASSRALIGVAENFVPPPVAHHDRFILLMSLPGEAWHLAGWHQDWYYNEGPPGTMTLYAPLQRTTAENGLLRFALGEHRRGVLPHGDYPVGDGCEFATKWHTIDPAEIGRFRRITTTELEVGDLLVFNSLVPHSAQINRSRAIRFVLNFRYHGLDDAAFTGDGWRIGDIGHARGALSRNRKEDSRR